MRLPTTIMRLIIAAWFAVFPIVMQVSVLTMDEHGMAAAALQDENHVGQLSLTVGCSDLQAYNCTAASDAHRCPSNRPCCDDAASCHAFYVDKVRLAIGELIDFVALGRPGIPAGILAPPTPSARLERPPRAAVIL